MGYNTIKQLYVFFVFKFVKISDILLKTKAAMSK